MISFVIIPQFIILPANKTVDWSATKFNNSIIQFKFNNSINSTIKS